MATILLVEDEPNQSRLYRMELEDEGYRVMSASDGKEALQAVEGERPDLVVLDLHMPGMDGVEALGRLLSTDSSLPVIIHSAYEGFKDNFMTWSADAYLVKSSNLDGLKQEIQRVLAEKAKVVGGSAQA
jgi:CheY-like chemotaxis protein